MSVRFHRPLVVGTTGAALILISAILMWAMGRDLICPCGTVKLWFAERQSAENSQHFSDPWTVVHFVGGFVFYFVARFVGRRWLTLGGTIILAMVMICGWEVLENTDIIIDRFRGAGAWDYYGDSVINGIGDMIAGLAGILLAAWLPTKVSILVVAALETAGLVLIRDSFVLNILLFIWPIEGIRDWQTALGA